jgi:hypothetical protein
MIYGVGSQHYHTPSSVGALKFLDRKPGRELVLEHAVTSGHQPKARDALLEYCVLLKMFAQLFRMEASNFTQLQEYVIFEKTICMFVMWLRHRVIGC